MGILRAHTGTIGCIGLMEIHKSSRASLTVRLCIFWNFTNWSNTWKHACYCAFMYTFTEKHACFHVISLFSAQCWPHWKRVHCSNNTIVNSTHREILYILKLHILQYKKGVFLDGILCQPVQQGRSNLFSQFRKVVPNISAMLVSSLNAMYCMCKPGNEATVYCGKMTTSVDDWLNYCTLPSKCPWVFEIHCHLYL